MVIHRYPWEVSPRIPHPLGSGAKSGTVSSLPPVSESINGANTASGVAAHSYPSVSVSAEPIGRIETSVLDNGVRIGTIATGESVCKIGIFVRAGS